MTELSFAHIDLTDPFSLVSVWKLDSRHYWELVIIERPAIAKGRCKNNDSLVLTTHINPNLVWNQRLAVKSIKLKLLEKLRN